MLRWPVDEDAGRVLLRLGCGIGAVKFLASRGRDVIAVRARNSWGPVLALPSRPGAVLSILIDPQPLIRTGRYADEGHSLGRPDAD